MHTLIENAGDAVLVFAAWLSILAAGAVLFSRDDRPTVGRRRRK